MMIQIDNLNYILLNGKRTVFSVHQTPIETAVVCHATGAPVWCPMPSRRYSLSHDNPSSNVQGRAQFERDFLLLIEA